MQVILIIFSLIWTLLLSFFIPYAVNNEQLSVSSAAILILCLNIFNLPYWSIIHEGIHGHLFANAKLNRNVSIILSSLFGISFTFVQVAHLTHHQMNRLPEEAPELFINKGQNKIKAQLRYYFMLFMGTYLFEVMGPLKFLIYSPKKLVSYGQKIYPEKSFLRTIHEKTLTKYKIIRWQSLLILIFWTLVLFEYSHHLFLFAFLFLGRAFLISFFDNIYHYGTPLYSGDYAKNLWLPKFISRFILNFNFHHVHHQFPQKSYNELPLIFAQHNQVYEQSFFWALLAQLKGINALNHQVQESQQL